MTSNHHNPNSHLPFDMLGYVFRYYAQKETVEHPLETLLLVCRSWNHAAVGHCTLWNNLNIHIGHKSISKIWNARLPLRLERCGTKIPLHIDLRNYLEMPKSLQFQDGLISDFAYSPFSCCHYCRGQNAASVCINAAKACVELAFKLLVGKKGELCARWCSFQVHLGSHGGYPAARALSYPTPNLEVLTIKYTNLASLEWVNMQLLPECASLKDIVLVNSEVTALPGLDGILQATLVWDDMSDAYPNMQALKQAVQLQSLTLQAPQFFPLALPAQLPDLTYLSIVGSGTSGGLLSCDMPRLSELRLTINFDACIADVFMWQGFHPESLRRLALVWDRPRLSKRDVTSQPRELMRLLALCTGLESVEIAGDPLMCLFIRWLSMLPEGSRRVTLRGKTIVNASRNDKVECGGDESPQWFELLALKWCLVSPIMEEDTFFKRLVKQL